MIRQLVLFLSCLAALANSAVAGLIGFDSINDRFIAIETDSNKPGYGSVRFVGATPFDTSSNINIDLFSMVYDSSAGVFLGWGQQPGNAAGFLYEVDIATGAAKRRGSSTTTVLSGLAYDPFTDTVYGSGGFSTLFTVNKSDGTTTQIGPMFSGSTFGTIAHGLTFDTSTPGGRLYMLGQRSNANPAFLHEVNRGTGLGSAVGTGIDPNLRPFSSLAFDSETDAIYSIDRNTSAGSFLSIDRTTGEETVLFTIPGNTSITALTFGAVPEPSSVCLLGFGLCACVLRRRRREELNRQARSIGNGQI